MTHSNRSTDRMMEILRSWFTQFRFVPHSELRLDMPCSNPLELEQYIHQLLKPNQFIPNHKVSGGTEMFTDINELRLLTYLQSYNRSMHISPPQLDKNELKVINTLLTSR